MPTTQRLALAVIIIGGLQGLLVFAAAWAAGREKKMPYLGMGFAWGVLTAMMMLSDCLRTPQGPSRVFDLAVPIYFAGLIGFPASMVWKRKPWVTRWLFAQLIMLPTLAPAFATAVAAALCSFT